MKLDWPTVFKENGLCLCKKNTFVLQVYSKLQFVYLNSFLCI